MRTLRKLLVLTLVIALLPAGFPLAVRAEINPDADRTETAADVPETPAQDMEQTVKLTGTPDEERALFFNDVLLRGSSARFDSFIEIGKGLRSAAGSYLELHYTVSPHLLAERSRLTVFVDDLPVDTIVLDPAGEEDKIWRLDLSGLQLEAGFHKISLAAQMRTTDLPVCEDPHDDRLWLLARDASQVYLNLVHIYERADLAWYPSPFLERGSKNPLRAILVVPDAPNSSEIAALARLSQYIVSQSPDNRLHIPVYTESEVTGALLARSHVIWIGEAKNWKNAGLQVVEAAFEEAGGIAAEAGDGAVILIPSLWNADRSHLLLTGTEQQLVKGADMLTNASLIEQLQGIAVPVGDAPAVLPESPADSEADMTLATTLKQLGIDQLVIQNTLYGTVQFQLALPADRVLGGPARLQLAYTHSEAILFGKSVMTVTVNGIPVESARLTRQTADGGELDIQIDPSVVGSSRNVNVEIAFQFVNPAAEVQPADLELHCEDSLIEDWAVIDGNSSLIVPLAERKTLDLQAIPFPFVGEEAWKHTLLLAPRWGSEELQLAMTLVGFIGLSNPKADALKSATTDSAEWKTEAKDAHVMYIGTADGLPAEFNGYGGSFFRVSGNRIEALSEHVTLLQPLLEDFALVQLTESPLSAGKALLIAAGSSDRRLSALSAAFADPGQAFAWSGRFVSVRPDGTVTNFPGTAATESPPALEVSSAGGRWAQFAVGETGFLIAVFIILAILSLAFGILRKQHRE